MASPRTRNLLGVPFVCLLACGGEPAPASSASEAQLSAADRGAAPSAEPAEASTGIAEVRGEPAETDDEELREPDPLSGWKTYRHPLGTVLRHPPDWRVRETATGLQFVPPGWDEERETIVGLAGEAGRLTDPMARATARHLDQLVTWSFPTLEREGAPRALAADGLDGAVHDWAGRAPDGTRVMARSWVIVNDGVLAGISLLADREHFERRAPVVEQIFTTLRDGRGDAGRDETDDLGDGGRDQRLVGRFRGESIASGEGIYVNTQLVWAFNPDGTVLYGAQSAMSASERDHDGNLTWSATGTSNGSMSTGRWSTDSGFLTLTWSDGSVGRFLYGFEPDGSLVYRNPVTRELVNFYAPVR